MLYLENRASGRFREVELLESFRFVVREGVIGTLGGTVRMVRPGDNAGHSLREMLERDGFEVVEPVPPLPIRPVPPQGLPGSPLSVEEAGRFGGAPVRTPSSMQRSLWQKRMGGFLYRTFSRRRRSYICPSCTSDLAQEFEEIAAWESPCMMKKVERDGRGMVTRIHYCVDGQWVLTLVNVPGKYMIQPFFIGVSCDGFAFSSRKHLLAEARELLTHFPAFCLDYLDRVVEEEQQELKQDKIRKLSSMALQPLVLDPLEAKGYDFRLDERRRSYNLRVQLAPITYVELSLPFEDTMRGAAHAMDTIQMVKGMFYAGTTLMEVVPTPVGMRWGEVRRYSSLFPAYYTGEPLWERLVFGYLERMLPREGHDASIVEDYRKRGRRWRAPGLILDRRFSTDMSSWRFEAAVRSTEAFLFIHGDKEGFELYFAGLDDWVVFNPEMGLPSEERMNAFIGGLPDFLRGAMRRLDRETGAALFERRVLHRLHGLRGIRWSLEIRSGGSMRVYLEMPRGMTLKVHLFYDNYEETLAELTDVIERVERVLAVASMPFRIRR